MTGRKAVKTGMTVVLLLMFLMVSGCDDKKQESVIDWDRPGSIGQEEHDDTYKTEWLNEAKAEKTRRRIFIESKLHKAALEYIDELVEAAIGDTVNVDVEIFEGSREFTDKELNSRPETKEEWRDFFSDTMSSVYIDTKGQSYDVDEVTASLAEGGITAVVSFSDLYDMLYHVDGITGETEPEKVAGY